MAFVSVCINVSNQGVTEGSTNDKIILFYQI